MQIFFSASYVYIIFPAMGGVRQARIILFSIKMGVFKRTISSRFLGIKSYLSEEKKINTFETLNSIVQSVFIEHELY